MEDKDFNQAYAQALRFLEPRFLSRQELTMKLVRKKFDRQIVEAVVEKLEEMDYINDDRLSIQVLNQLASTLKYGRLQIVKKMMLRGLKVPSAINDYNEIEAAQRLAERYFPDHKGPYKRDKVIRYFKNRGFDKGTIFEISDGLNLDTEDYC